MTRPLTKNARKKKIAELNDQFRKTGIGGMIMMTDGIQLLGQEITAKILAAVQEFNAFTKHNDPCGEHNLGIVVVEDAKCYFKIDYYDRNVEYGSEDPADPEQTTRVMTIMLPDEY